MGTAASFQQGSHWGLKGHRTVLGPWGGAEWGEGLPWELDAEWELQMNWESELVTLSS